jgi:hypothetical protein
VLSMNIEGAPPALSEEPKPHTAATEAARDDVGRRRSSGHRGGRDMVGGGRRVVGIPPKEREHERERLRLNPCTRQGLCKCADLVFTQRAGPLRGNGAQ